MSASAIWTVHCHAQGDSRSPDCMWWTEGNPDESRVECERGARKAGWIVKPGINLCPACKEVQPHD